MIASVTSGFKPCSFYAHPNGERLLLADIVGTDKRALAITF
jgi:hypothetical protein